MASDTRGAAAEQKHTFVRSLCPFLISSLISYASVFVSAPNAIGQRADPIIQGAFGELIFLFPGLIFSIALFFSINEKIISLKFALVSIIISTGWYIAYYTSSWAEYLFFFFFTGTVSGLIGGLFVGIGMCTFLMHRKFNRVIITTIVGGILGGISLPAGFLFHDPKNLYTIFITFFIWQTGVGLFVKDLHSSHTN